jgi:DNA ligase-1
MKPIPNKYVQSLFGRPELEGLDGELIVGDPTAQDCYRVTVSGVMRESGEPDVTFHVFDTVDITEVPFRNRLHAVADTLWGMTAPIQIVPHDEISNVQELDDYETWCLEQGFEGVMIRDPNGTYKQGRSTLKQGGLLKLKRFSDSEAEIIGFEERMTNTNEKLRDERGYSMRSTAQSGLVPSGTLGALNVRDIVSGVEFSVGTGFDDATRASIWAERGRLRGVLIKYKHFSIGNYDKPRFPTFLGFRAAMDM